MSALRLSSMSGEFENILRNSSYAACLETKWTFLTSGMARSSRSTASISSGAASAFMKIEPSTPPRHWMVALSTPCLRSRAPPTRASDTATTTIAAEVMKTLRRRLDTVSRAK